MSRHAYCIIAHKDLYTLNKLLELLDDERNDIFLFFDKKWDISVHHIHQPLNSQPITPPHIKGTIFIGETFH